MPSLQPDGFPLQNKNEITYHTGVDLISGEGHRNMHTSVLEIHNTPNSEYLFKQYFYIIVIINWHQQLYHTVSDVE